LATAYAGVSLECCSGLHPPKVPPEGFEIHASLALPSDTLAT
jgi:hypothetical protein